MLSSVLVPIFICVVLPVSIVLIVCIASMNNDNKRTQVLLKAIEMNPNVDPEKLAAMFVKPHKSAREIRNRRLLYGCAFTLSGLIFELIGLFNLIFGYADTVASDDPVCMPMLFGALPLAIGISFLVVYFATRRQVNDNK